MNGLTDFTVRWLKLLAICMVGCTSGTTTDILSREGRSSNIPWGQNEIKFNPPTEFDDVRHGDVKEVHTPIPSMITTSLFNISVKKYVMNFRSISSIHFIG